MESVSETKTKKILLFTGHMLDAANRPVPRFPKERETEIRQKIKDNVTGILEADPAADDYMAIAGGACGGDLLFLEICKELGIHIKMMLALPPEKFIDESVAFAGNTWVDRFYTIYEDMKTEVSIMAKSKESPVSSKGQDDYSFWERNNLWLLNTALNYGGSNVILIAVWDGKRADGPGGTEHMVDTIRKRGAEIIVIPI